VDQGSDRVELVGGGWSGSIGYCTTFSWERPCRNGGVEWEKVTSPSFVFSQTAALLVAQGMKLSDLFPPDVSFVVPHKEGDLRVRGPFLLLKGTFSRPSSPPLRLQDMVLARVSLVPGGMPDDEVRAVLLRAVQ
jgi:hypothetical protein